MIITRTVGSLVPRISLRDVSGSSLTVDASRLQQRQGFLEDAALGQRQSELLRHAFTRSIFAPTARQLHFHAVVAAIEVIDAVDHRFALRRQRGNHQDAEARKSVAITGAPTSFSTPARSPCCRRSRSTRPGDSFPAHA